MQSRLDNWIKTVKRENNDEKKSEFCDIFHFCWQTFSQTQGRVNLPKFIILLKKQKKGNDAIMRRNFLFVVIPSRYLKK